MNSQNASVKNGVLVVGSILVIAASSFWIYRKHFAAPRINVALHQAVGRVMAEETAGLLNNEGKIVVIAVESPELRVQLEAFEKTLGQFKKVTIKKTYMVDTENKPKYGPGSGLSGPRLVRIVNKNPNADAIVSFIGAADISEAEIGQLQARPRLIAESRSAENLKTLFDKQLLHVAVVSRFQFPAPVEGNPGTLRQWFDKRFQIVRPESAATLPSSAAE